MLLRLLVVTALVLACSSKKEDKRSEPAVATASDAGSADGAAPAWAAAAGAETKDVCIHLADLLMKGPQAAGGHDLGRCRTAWKANAACGNHDAMRSCVLAAGALKELRACPKCEPPPADSAEFCTWAVAPAMGLFGNHGIAWAENGCPTWSAELKGCLTAAGADPVGHQRCLAEHDVEPPPEAPKLRLPEQR